MKKKYIVYVGVVGQIAVGKGILVKYLTDKLEFVSFSLSSILHDELKKKGIKKFTRKTLQDIGDKLRNRYGDDVLARRAVEFLKKQGERHVVIEGIRNPGEIEFLKKNPSFILIGVKADREIRFKRLLERGKPWDPKTWNDFVNVDRRDLGIGQQKSGQQVGKCLAYCDYVLTNNKDLKDFERKVKDLMKKIFKLNGTS
ncbi:AAA family ATPase [Candidatus Roizmanbacteria bacterium]|nr:AAA family ATPase [Candidatus Roizmanbacteria bacterium]